MKLLAALLLSLILLLSFQQKEKEIVRMAATSCNTAVVKVDTLTLNLQDTIPNKTIKIYTDKNGYPVKYSRNIVTGVCIDGECRMVAINLFWNVTGRYLGFELPEGEFLSKTEHDPFNSADYTRLHEILIEVNSSLASYTIDELVPVKDTAINDLDAVSSATIEAILAHIVEGAVYTTYTLWHIVHGQTMHEIEKLSANRLNSELALLILNSENTRDQVWTLNHITGDMEISEELQAKLMTLISGSNIYLAERALNALKPELLSHDIQLKLAAIFKDSGFLQKRIIIQKLKQSEVLHPDAVHIISSILTDLNGTLTKNILDLYTFHNIEDDYTVSVISQLVKNDNRYIANEAIRYLESLDSLDKKTLKSIEKYKKRNS